MSKLIYITGLSGSGKTTIGKALQKEIPNSILLDGDEIRSTINTDLGFDIKSKVENIRRNNALIKLLYDQDFVVICAFMASIKEERDKIFKHCTNAIKIQLITSICICKERDPKQLYKQNLQNFAGVNMKYEPFDFPDITLDTHTNSLNNCIKQIIDKYKKKLV
jgi:adenylylsulfate kinase-like enzyme